MLEQAWLQVAREAVGPEGRVVDLVIYGATQRGEALCCDATRVPAWVGWQTHPRRLPKSEGAGTTSPNVCSDSMETGARKTRLSRHGGPAPGFWSARHTARQERREQRMLAKGRCLREGQGEQAGVGSAC